MMPVFAVTFLEYIILAYTMLIFNMWPNKFGLVTADLPNEASFNSWVLFASTEEKTEAATPHRQQEARKKGQVGKSPDLNGAIVILAIVITLYITRGYIGLNISEYLQQILVNEVTTALSTAQLINVYKFTLYVCFKIMAPMFAIALLIGLAANFLQVGFIFSSEAIKPKLSNISALEGFRRIFSKRALFDFLKTLMKITIIGLVIYNLVKDEFPKLLFLPNMSIGAIANYSNTFIFRVCITAGMVYLIISVFDFAFQKWQFNQTLKMSKYEVKNEMKQTEGDPLIKSRLREKQRLIAMRRMMQSVPEATVVITNPTHLAVALKYDDNKMQAPQIVAKGASYIAEKIKEKAAENKIPIIEDKPLARSLYKGSEIGDYVPVELYQAVAGVLAAIYAQS
jgi:flagellar biosynthetic protein FlhB